MFAAVSRSRRAVSLVVVAVAVLAVAGFLLPLLTSAPGTAARADAASAVISQSDRPASLALAAPLASRGAANPLGPEIPPGVTFGVNYVISVPPNNTSAPIGVAVDTANGNVYVTDSGSSSVSVISGSTETVFARIPVGSNPSGVVYDAKNTYVYVANFLDDVVEVINTTTNVLQMNITVTGGPVGVAYDSTSGNVYVTAQDLNTVDEISGASNTIIGSVLVGSYPIAATFDPANNNLYVANAGSDNVSVISTLTNSVTATVPVGTTPLGIAYDGGTGNVYVTNQVSNNTTVFSASSLRAVASVATSPYPVGVTYDPAYSAVFVTDEGDTRVNVLADSTNSIAQNVTVQSFPVGIAYNSVNGFVYVADANTSNVSVIGTSLHPPYLVTFTESGLASGTNWSVTLAGNLSYSKSSTITFKEYNGTYDYAVGAIPGYTVSTAKGSVTVNGFPVPVPIVFTLVTYVVTFQETGLASDTTWWVTFNSLPQETNTTAMAFSVANGTYRFAVTAISGFTISPASGNVTVNGTGSTLTITFTSSNVPPAHSGSSPSGTPWWVYAVIAVVIAALVLGIVLLLRQRKGPTATAPNAPSTTTGAGPGSQ